jgi:hypothetical protein
MLPGGNLALMASTFKIPIQNNPDFSIGWSISIKSIDRMQADKVTFCARASLRIM